MVYWGAASITKPQFAIRDNGHAKIKRGAIDISDSVLFPTWHNGGKGLLVSNEVELYALLFMANLRLVLVHCDGR